MINNISASECFKDYPDVVSIENIQEMLHIGRNAVYNLLRSKTIHSLKIGKKYIIPKQCVIQYLSTVTA